VRQAIKFLLCYILLSIYIITTSSSTPFNPEIALRNPLPDVGGYDVMMLISNRIAVRKILKAGFDKDTKFKWNIILHEGQGDLGLDWLQAGASSTLEVDIAPVDGTSFPGNLVKLPIYEQNNTPGFTIKAKEGMHDIACALNSKFNQSFTMGSANGKADLVMKFSDVPIEINVRSSDSSIIDLRYNFVASSMQVTSEITELSYDQCCDKAPEKAQERLVENTQAKFGGKMVEALNGVQFQSVSVLLLQSILFPGGQYMKLTGANNPGDIALWGQLLTD